METIDNLLYGFEIVFTLDNLTYSFLGVLLGTFIGVLPGLGSLAAISMLLPVTFYLEPTSALIMLAGIYYGAEYGGSITAILLNIPGTPSSSVTCLDGSPMAKNGKAGIALFITAIASFTGGTLGIIALVAFAPSIAEVGLAFGAADYFALMVLGLTAAVTISTGSALKGLGMTAFGVLLGTIGTDPVSGVDRYTFGIGELADGINLVVLAMGLFGIAEVIGSLKGSRHGTYQEKITFSSMIPSKSEMKSTIMPMLRGSSIGGFLGALPGTGQVIASFMSYAVEIKLAKSKDKFGKGAVEGIAAPESANNAASQTAFIPTMTIGIPGSATMALMLAALMIHGITPGPLLISDRPDVFWGLVASFWVGNLLLLVLNIPLIGMWVKLLSIPYKYLYPIVLCLICLGTYAIRFSELDVLLAMVFGGLGYFFQRTGFPPAALLLGFILGPMLEENLRRAMLLSRGDPMQILSAPLSGSILFISALLILSSIVSGIKKYRNRIQKVSTSN